ncbi:MAG: ABC transporter permease [Ilumatobacteraceae bacterium]
MLRWFGRGGRTLLVLTVLGAALAFATSLLMSGVNESFSAEVSRTLDRMDADWWVTRADAPGPFSGGSLLTADDVGVLTGPGMGFTEASAALFGSTTAQTNPGSDNSTAVTVTVLGVVPGAVGAPQTVDQGTTDLAFGQVIVPRSLGRSVGDSITIAGAVLSVGGVVDEASLDGGAPTITMRIEEAQRLLLGGQPLASMVVAKGAADLPGTYVAHRRPQVEADLLRPLHDLMQTFDVLGYLLWLVAGLIIAVAVRAQRTRVPPLSSMALSLIAAVVGIGLALLVTPLMPLQVEFATSAMVLMLLPAAVLGAAAALVGVRRATPVAGSDTHSGEADPTSDHPVADDATS